MLRIAVSATGHDSRAALEYRFGEDCSEPGFLLLHYWRAEIQRLLIVLAVTALIGWLAGNMPLAMLIGVAGYLLVNYWQLWRLRHWLQGNPSATQTQPPESFGLWGEVFDGIYKLGRQEQKTRNYLESIIRKAQESSAALEIAVIMIDQQGSLVWWNLAGTRLLGFQYPRDQGHPVTNLVRDPRFSQYFHDADYSEPLKLPAPGDNSRTLEFEIALFGEQERLMIVRDVTQLHRMELMREDFVGNVSHELGTPITVIKGYLETIMDNVQDLEEKWRKPLRQMFQQSARMENIVHDLLMLTALETKAVKRQQKPCNLHLLIREVEHDTEQIYQDKGHKFSTSCDSELEIVGDRAELYSALSNLAQNAAKYTPDKGDVRIEAEYVSDGEAFEIRVIDNGIGVEPQHISRLTERFYRVDISRSSETGGTGLGLAIVKHILMRHDADLHISSESGNGSVFSCRFPAERIKGPDKPRAPAQAPFPDQPPQLNLH